MSKEAKTIIIVVAVVAIILLIAMAGYFMYRSEKLNKTTGTTWGDTYYTYLKDVKSSKDKTQYGLSEDTTSASVEFIQVEEEANPVMIMSYAFESESVPVICYIDDDGNVVHTNGVPGTIEYLYNVEDSKYSWYLHVKEYGEAKYQSIENIIEVNKDQTTETKAYTFVDDASENGTSDNYYSSSDNSNAEIDNISDFDTVFVETGINDTSKVDIDFNASEMDYKKLITNSLNGYKANDELLTEEVNQAVITKIQEVNQMKVEQQQQQELEKVKLTNDVVNSRIGDNLKWFTAAYLGSAYGWADVYEYKNVTGNVTIPGQNKYAMVYEVVGLNSINDLKTGLANYMTSDVISKLASAPEFSQYLEEYEGKVYWVSGGVGDGPEIDYDKAKVESSDGVSSKVVLEEYDSLTNTKMNEITLTVNYENGKYMITDYQVENKF